MIVYTPITLALKEKIIDQIGGDCVVSDPKTIEEYSHDASELTHEPELILEVQSARQVSLILEMANRYRFPVTPRGGGTGLAGGGRAFVTGRYKPNQVDRYPESHSPSRARCHYKNPA